VDSVASVGSAFVPAATVWHQFRRYLRLYGAVARYCLARDLEYRTNMVFNLFREGFYAGLQVMFVNLIYLNVKSVGDWSSDQMLVLMGSYTIVTNLTYCLFWETMTGLSSLVNTGELDLVLTKPVNGQFLVSIRRIAFMNLAPVTFGFVIVSYGISRLGVQPGLADILGYLVLCGCGVALCYAMWFSSVLLVFWTGRMQNIAAVFEPVVSMARVPTDVLRGPIRLAFTFVIPLAFAGTVPARALLGVGETWHLPFAIVAAIGAVFASNRLWNRALREYSSASS
jgi:ABC-2 type transport system permease protein